MPRDVYEISELRDAAFLAHPFGPLNALTYGNALTFSATFDQDYYLTNRTVSGGIYNHTYDTDANGNITQVGSTTFNYDELNRLEEEDPGSAVNYTYDATSNRLTKVNGGTVSTTVPGSSNKISAVGGDSYTYDAAGNITDDGTNEYTWNAEGELEEVEVSSTPVGTYTYNVYRQRTKKVAGSTTHFIYGAGGLLYGEYDTSGDFIREYVYLNGEPLAQIDAGSPEVLTYLHTDHLGTPKFGTNSGGTQVWSWAPDAFGVGSPSGSVTVNLRMPGQYFDSESGLFYNWNRYYNPAIGRYISSDPIGLAGGLNTFLYANANPLLYSDPTGEAAQVLVIGGCAVILGVGIAIQEQLEKCRKDSNSLCNRPLFNESANDNADDKFDWDAQKEAERRDYHSFCDTPPPPTGDPCLDAKANVQWHQGCLDLREAFTNKWYNGQYDAGHAQQMVQKRRALAKAKADVRKYCATSDAR